MKFSFKKLLQFFITILVLVGASWLGYDRWQEQEDEKIHWAETVNNFRDCSLSDGLELMGKPYLYEQYISSSSVYKKSKNELTRMITSGYREGVIKGLDDVWIDPNIQNSLSNKKSTSNSINLLSQCNLKIADGVFSRGLDMAYYYLYIGYPNAVDLINDLSERGVTDAYVLLGHAYRQGLLSSVKDEKMAFAYYLKSANSGSTKGMLNAAELLRSVDFEKSKKFVLAAAEEGSLTAAYILQDISGIYRTPAPGKSRTENDVKVLYFWNLVFTSLRARELKRDLNVTLENSRRSPFIGESNHEFEFDSVPNRPWQGEDLTRPIDFKKIYYYFEENVKDNQKQLETTLNSDDRIQVQSRAEQWMSSLNKRSKTDKRILDLPKIDNENTPPPSTKNKLKVEV